MTERKTFETNYWKQLKKRQFQIFDKGFVHEKLFTFKVNKQGSDSTIKLKEVVAQKEGKINVNDQLNLWIPFKEGCYARAGLRKNDFLLELNSRPLKSDSGTQYTFDGSYQAKKTFRDAIFKVAMNIKTPSSIRSWRIRLDRDIPGILLEEKQQITKDNTCLQLYNACDILNNFSWRASSLQFTWRKSQKFTAQIRTGWKRKTGNLDWRNFIENVCFASIYKFSDVTDFGLEMNASLWPIQLRNLTALWQYHNSQGITFKVKGDINRNICFSVKNPISNYGYYTFGALISDFGRANKISYGLQFDLDI